MPTNTLSRQENAGTDDNRIDGGIDEEHLVGPREDCWCAEKELACWDHYRRERQLRGEF